MRLRIVLGKLIGFGRAGLGREDAFEISIEQYGIVIYPSCCLSQNSARSRGERREKC